MSNCINITNGTIHFVPDEVDAQKFQALIADAEKEVNKDNCVDLNVDSDKRIAWWFLNATEFAKSGAVKVYFQAGRSGHTWRDFDHTLRTISKFVKKSKVHKFCITDEYDDFATPKMYTVNLQTAEYL